jgi:hypothetical protein
LIGLDHQISIHIGFTQHITRFSYLRAYFLRVMETTACKVEHKRMRCDAKQRFPLF